MTQDNTTMIRVATKEDIGLLRELSTTTFRETFAEHNTPEDMEDYLRESFSLVRLMQELADPQATFFIAELAGKPLGYAKLKNGEPDVCVTGAKPMELVRLYVLAESIGHGVGAVLMSHCIQTAKDRGFQTLWLGVWEHNNRAIRFYRKWGYEEVGSHAFQLGKEAQTDWIMQKSL